MNPMTKENIPNMPQIPSSDSIAMMNDINENKKNMIPKERFVCLSGSISMFEISISYGSIMFEISISYGSIMILGGDFFFFLRLLFSNSRFNFFCPLLQSSYDGYSIQNHLFFPFCNQRKYIHGTGLLTLSLD